MTAYLLDTNILLRAADPASPLSALAREAVAGLLERGEQCCLTPQVLIEFWSVATHPLDVNGLGWDNEKTAATIGEFIDQFPLLEDAPAVFSHWLRLVTANAVSGKRVHDARLVAVMQAHGIFHLLTFNLDDFRFDAGITLVHPREVV